MRSLTTTHTAVLLLAAVLLSSGMAAAAGTAFIPLRDANGSYIISFNRTSISGTRINFSQIDNVPAVLSGLIPASNVSTGTFPGIYTMHNLTIDTLLNLSYSICSAGQVLSTNASGIVQCVTPSAGAGGLVIAENVTTGTFGALIGRGNYSFLDNLSIGRNLSLSNLTSCTGKLTTDSIGRIACASDSTGITAVGGGFGITSSPNPITSTGNISVNPADLINNILLTQANITSGISIPFTNTTGTATQQCGSGNVTNNVTIINGVLTIGCTPDTGSGSGVTIPANNVTTGTFPLGNYTFTGPSTPGIRTVKINGSLMIVNGSVNTTFGNDFYVWNIESENNIAFARINAGAGTRVGLRLEATSINSQWEIENENNGPTGLMFRYNGADFVQVTTAGNVGIGMNTNTAPATSKLHVNGTINTTGNFVSAANITSQPILTTGNTTWHLDYDDTGACIHSAHWNGTLWAEVFGSC